MSSIKYPSISLEAARVNAGYTQSKAAIKLTLQNYEKGITFPTTQKAKEMAALYNFPEDYIFFG